MKKKLKRFLLITLCLCMVVGSTCGSAYAATTVSFGNSQTVVDTFNGVPAYYKIGNHNTDSTYSCAAFVKRYYSTIYGVSVSNLTTDKTPKASPSSYSFRRVYTGEVLPGDIGYQSNSSGGGHWFIIKSVSGNNLTVIEQNWKKSTASTCTKDRVVSFGATKNLKVFRLQKSGIDVNGSSNNNNNNNNNSDDYSGIFAIMANSKYCLNVLFASTISDAAKCAIDPFNGESNELFKITKYGNYYRISPLHAPNLALNAQFGKDAKAGQQLSLHTWQNNDSASLWSIEKVNGGVRFRNKANTNLVIDVNQGLKSSTGNRINLWIQNNSDAQVFTLVKQNGDSGGSSNSNANTASDYSGRWAIKANTRYCLNVQFASTISDAAKCVIDPFNGEANEIFQFTRYGNYYRISPLHAPNLALNAQFGKDAKAGQQLSLHTWQNNDSASLWSIESVNGGVRFRNKANTNLVIDVNQGLKSSTGNRINLWIQNNSDAQVFSLQRA